MTEFPAHQRPGDPGHIFELLKEQGAKLDQIADELRAHTQSEAQRMLAIERGFPDDDPGGHRAYHEAIIRRAEQRAEFWQKLSVELAKWGLIGFLGWLAVAAYHEAMKGFGR